VSPIEDIESVVALPVRQQREEWDHVQVEQENVAVCTLRCGKQWQTKVKRREEHERGDHPLEHASGVQEVEA
jgi:hypothetical protein